MLMVASVFLPLLGATIAGFFGRFIGNRGAHIVTCLGIGLAAPCILGIDLTAGSENVG